MEKNKIDDIIEKLQEPMVFLTDMEECIIGYTNINDKNIFVCSFKKAIDILMKEMSEGEAIEYFEYNIKGSYFGEYTPIWMFEE